ncbi:unnamed protein product [Periconia digitata]|uniref:Uncharacterized protein n=1 Tax=Periconia digitata TaxID=1303443 RepID=A0A9W4U2N5_9PLEO|nr:unnamed protein product [Periconia digitata]
MSAALLSGCPTPESRKTPGDRNISALSSSTSTSNGPIKFFFVCIVDLLSLKKRFAV